MAIIILPDAQEDLLALQRYMLKQWGLELSAKAENEIFNLLDQIEAGKRSGQPVPELAEVGITDYLGVLTSHRFHDAGWSISNEPCNSLSDFATMLCVIGLRTILLMNTCPLKRNA